MPVRNSIAQRVAVERKGLCEIDVARHRLASRIVAAGATGCKLGRLRVAADKVGARGRGYVGAVPAVVVVVAPGHQRRQPPVER
eukprot:2632637-Prymnesium_polylepis.1